MATRKSTPSAEKKTTARKAPAKKAAAATQSTPVAADPVEIHTTPAKRTPSYDEIARLAEQFWNERGRPFGSPEVDWLRAEQTLQAA
jgi:hypothetical protein